MDKAGHVTEAKKLKVEYPEVAVWVIEELLYEPVLCGSRALENVRDILCFREEILCSISEKVGKRKP